MDKTSFSHLFTWVGFVFVIVAGRQVRSADVETMENHLRNYFSQTRHHDVNQTYKDRAMQFIYDEFRKFGLETEFQMFQEQRVSSEKNFTNVIGILKGENFGSITDRIVGVAAHYDTVNNTSGVDDNGAGVVAMLDVARQLTAMNKTNWKRKNTILFLSFDIEEQGLYGSQAFVNQWLPKYFSEHYGPNYADIRPYGVIVMDTMMEYNTTDQSQKLPAGAEQLFQRYMPQVLTSLQADNFQGDFMVLTYRNTSADYDLGTSFENAWKSLDRPDFEIEAIPLPISDVSVIQAVGFRDFLRSDHTSFWVANLPAIFLSDSANFRGDMINCYHNPCDNLEVMLTDDNIRFLGKTADTITKTIHQLSDPYQGTSGVVPLHSNLLLMCATLLVTHWRKLI